METYEDDNAQYLKDSIESIVRQTLTDFGLILSVDGPVSDCRKAFLEELAVGDSRIRVLWNQINRGPAATRNAAITALE